MSLPWKKVSHQDHGCISALETRLINQKLMVQRAGRQLNFLRTAASGNQWVYECCELLRVTPKVLMSGALVCDMGGKH
jgi:hypothetical protein